MCSATSSAAAEERLPALPVHFDSTRTDNMMEASPLITGKEAERRVIILGNPGPRGQSEITTALYAGIRLLMPLAARTLDQKIHRHSLTIKSKSRSSDRPARKSIQYTFSVRKVTLTAAAYDNSFKATLSAVTYALYRSSGFVSGGVL
jgi:hypothetical protein